MIVRCRPDSSRCERKFSINYKEKKQTEQQVASAALKRIMSECERESEVIEIDNDITVPGASRPTGLSRTN